MPPPVLPPGATLKFARARAHLRELKTQTAEYRAAEPFKIVEYEDTSTGDLVTRVDAATQPSADLSVVIGDVVHNARSALDQLAWYLVERDGGTPGKFTYFPTGETKSKFVKSVKEALAGTVESTRVRVRALAVYPGGDEELWLLHQLDIEDKHRLLIPVGMAYGAFNLHVKVDGFGDGKLLEVPPVAFRPADAMYPLKVDDEIFRVAKAARETDQGVIQMTHSFRFDLAFGGASLVAAGKPLSPTLDDLVDHAEQQARTLL